jgi:hypothetical protein
MFKQYHTPDVSLFEVRQFSDADVAGLTALGSAGGAGMGGAVGYGRALQPRTLPVATPIGAHVERVARLKARAGGWKGAAVGGLLGAAGIGGAALLSRRMGRKKKRR